MHGSLGDVEQEISKLGLLFKVHRCFEARLTGGFEVSSTVGLGQLPVSTFRLRAQDCWLQVTLVQGSRETKNAETFENEHATQIQRLLVGLISGATVCCVYIYIYIYRDPQDPQGALVSLSLSIPLALNIYIYIYIYM